MELIKIFMGILLSICLFLCVDYKKFCDVIIENSPNAPYCNNLSLLGLKVHEFKGKVRVSEVLDYTPAKYSGIECGDRIIEIEGHRINNLKDYFDCLIDANDNETITMKIYRRESCSLFPVIIVNNSLNKSKSIKHINNKFYYNPSLNNLNE